MIDLIYDLSLEYNIIASKVSARVPDPIKQQKYFSVGLMLGQRRRRRSNNKST